MQRIITAKGGSASEAAGNLEKELDGFAQSQGVCREELELHDLRVVEREFFRSIEMAVIASTKFVRP